MKDFLSEKKIFTKDLDAYGLGAVHVPLPSMYLPVNTRDEGNPILAILGGMAETFFFAFCLCKYNLTT